MNSYEEKDKLLLEDIKLFLDQTRNGYHLSVGELERAKQALRVYQFKVETYLEGNK